MKRILLFPFLVIVAACGGGAPDTPEEAIKAYIELINETAAVMKTVKDKSSADAAKPKLEKLAERAKEIETATKKLPEPDPALQQKYMPEIQKAMMSLMEAAQGMPNDPEIQKILGEISKN